MRIQSFLAAVLAVAVVAMLTVGCGDAGDDTSNAGAEEATTAAKGDTASPETDGEAKNDGGFTGGGESTQGTTLSAERKRFIRRADAYCRKAGQEIFAEIQALLPEAGLDRTPLDQQAELVGRVVVPGFEAEIEGIRELEPPEEDAEQVEEVLAAMQTTANIAREDPLTFVSEGNPFLQAQEIAERYGFEFCGGIGPKPAGT